MEEKKKKEDKRALTMAGERLSNKVINDIFARVQSFETK